MPKVPYPYEVNGKLYRKWFLDTNLFLIKPFLITKFDCTCKFMLYELLNFIERMKRQRGPSGMFAL